MSLEVILAGMLLAALVFYVLTAGADYGAGLWSLLAWGKRGRLHQQLIDRAIAPIWEANHVWLILVVTILFAGFPPAFALISTTLHLPLTALLVGIVLRGSAFAFRTNDVVPRQHRDRAQRFWGGVFAGSSVLAPLMLGTTIGAVASGRLSHRLPTFYQSFVAPWLTTFPLLVGCFTIALFAYLAAIYLIFESPERTVQDDFRRRALWSWSAVAGIGAVVLWISKRDASDIYEGLTGTTAGHVTVVSTIVISLVSVLGLLYRWYGTARAGAAVQVTLIVFGWALSQYPYVVVPDLTLANAAAPEATLRLLIWSLVLGGVVLFPCLYYLYRIFKRHAFVTPPQR